ncbi:MAG: NnrS family protein [Aestuariivirga sp.]
MATTAQQIRAWQGPAILGYGFRPFFLGAAAYAATVMAVWIGALLGAWSIPSAYGMVEWHAHEFIWGYLPAVIAGFLLTAIPNWTGRLPIVGVPLAILWCFWFAGRLAMFVSSYLPVTIAAAIDLSFLAVLLTVVAREIIAGRNWTNLKVLAVVTILAIGNIVFHTQVITGGNAASGIGVRIGMAATVLLIALVGGRIVPSFTRNWLAKRGPGALPAQFGWFDQAVLAVTVLALLLWTLFPASAVSGAIGLLTGALNLLRLARWAGWRSFAEPLVAILHAGYLFVPVGFLLTGSVALWPETVPRAAAQHAWMAGAIAVMTLAVMTRASLGHSGRPLVAGKGITAIYGLVTAAAVTRVFSGIVPGIPWLLEIAGAAWIMAFIGFVIIYIPLLVLRPAK